MNFSFNNSIYYECSTFRFLQSRWRRYSKTEILYCVLFSLKISFFLFCYSSNFRYGIKVFRWIIDRVLRLWKVYVTKICDSISLCIKQKWKLSAANQKIIGEDYETTVQNFSLIALWGWRLDSNSAMKMERLNYDELMMSKLLKLLICRSWL